MEDIDIKKLEYRFIEVDAQFMAQNRIIDSQRDEILHLRQIIEMLVTSQSPKL